MSMHNFVDLSLDLNGHTPVYPGDPIPKIDVATTVENDGYNLFGLYLGSQSGSHIDAPYHFSNQGMKLDEMALEQFYGRGLLIDMSYKAQLEPIELTDVEPYLSKIADHPFVLIKTGWDATQGTEKFFEHPFVTQEVATAFVENGIKFLGMDTINVDMTGGVEFPVHDLFAANKLIIGENWANFSGITTDNFYVSALPLKMHTDGSPVRAVAIEVTDDY